jgi:hypothetical protein
MTGPVWIPKIYDGRNRTFTFGFEDLLIQRNLSFTGTVPTEKQRRGDFSALLNLGARYQIYDPFTIQPAPNGRFSRQSLPGNVIYAAQRERRNHCRHQLSHGVGRPDSTMAASRRNWTSRRRSPVDRWTPRLLRPSGREWLPCFLESQPAARSTTKRPAPSSPATGAFSSRTIGG